MRHVAKVGRWGVYTRYRATVAARARASARSWVKRASASATRCSSRCGSPASSGTSRAVSQCRSSLTQVLFFTHHHHLLPRARGHAGQPAERAPSSGSRTLPGNGRSLLAATAYSMAIGRCCGPRACLPSAETSLAASPARSSTACHPCSRKSPRSGRHTKVAIRCRGCVGRRAVRRPHKCPGSGAWATTPDLETLRVVRALGRRQ